MNATLNPSRAMQPTGPKPQQAWSLPLFVTQYNHYADEHGGYYYEPDSRTVKLEQSYQKSAHPTVQAYAWGVYQYDQM